MRSIPPAFRVLSALAVALLLPAVTPALAAGTNVILVLVDDMGWSDLGCYGSEISTPTLDGLAANGLRFRNFYNAARCSPTRCSILTGLYTQQVASNPGASLPNLRNDNNVTIAELLQASGYRTYMAGKWHLGNTAALLPEGRGFQHVWRFANGAAHSTDQWDINNYTLVSQNNEIAFRPYSGPGETFYQSDAIGDYAVDFINHHVGKTDSAPFFLCLAFGAPHFPIQAPAALANSYTTVYQQGWDVIRYQRYTNQLTTGVIDARYPFPPLGGTAVHQNEPVVAIPAWNTIAAGRQADLVRRMALYAAMIDKIDQNISNVVTRLQQVGQLDNTLILFLSDNGGNHERGRFGTWNQGSASELGPLTGSALANMGQPGRNDSIHYGGGWAHVSNTPFRLFKHFAHGGGIRTPLIVHWPDGLTRSNHWEEQPGHLNDILSTIVDATGINYPTQFNGHPVLPMEGQSLRPLFIGEPPQVRELGFEHENNRAWISNNWKFATKNFTLYDNSSPAHELELYDLNIDPGEATNRADDFPERTVQMVEDWNAWATRVGVPLDRLITPPPVNRIPAPGTNDLFLDTFSRGNLTDIDASAGGMSGQRMPPLGASAAYYEGFEGSGSATSIQIVDGMLQMAAGNGMSENGIIHNFVGQDIIDAGGFSVEVSVQTISSTATDAANRYVGFGVGLSQAEAASGWDINDSLPANTVAFRGSTTGNAGVADFFIELDLNGNLKVWSNGALLDTVPVGAVAGTITAKFELAGFGTSDTVTVTVFFDGRLLDINTPDTNSVTRTFHWDRSNSNFIGLSARASSYTQMDNLVVRRLPLAGALATGHALRAGLSGTEAAQVADPDEDTLANFGEWAFGGDPATADRFVAKLGLITVTPDTDFTFSHRRFKAYALADVAYRVWYSENLEDWFETSATVLGATPIDADYETVELQLLPSVVAGRDRLYIRVQAVPRE